MRRAHSALLATTVLGLAGAATGGSATFTLLPAGAAVDVTPDGGTVLLHDFGSGSAWLWTADGGLTLIGSGNIDQAGGIADDGRSVGGSIIEGGLEQAALWTEDSGTWTALGGLPGETGCDAFLSSGYDISGDGLDICGLGWEGCQGRAMRWNEGTGMVALPQDGPISSRANTVSGDGLVVGGWDEGPTGSRRPSAWFDDASCDGDVDENGTVDTADLLDVLAAWGPCPGCPEDVNGDDVVDTADLLIVLAAWGPCGSELIFGEIGEVFSMNRDGSVIAGNLAEDAFYWTEASGVVSIGKLTSIPADRAFGLDMTADGGTIVGTSGDRFFGSPLTAFIWTGDTGMERLRDVLIAAGAGGLDDVHLESATAISDDGTVIVGYIALPPFGTQAFVATLPGGP